MLRIDDVEYQHVLGLRLNVWTSIVLFVLAAVYFVISSRKRPGRETEVYTQARLATAAATGASVPDAATETETPEGNLEPATAKDVKESPPEPEPHG
ncbi:MAG: hypothetical protein QM747_19020 [Nocardioides sp.]